MMNGAPAIVEELAGGEVLVALDATAEEAWSYFDLDGAGLVTVDDPFVEMTWDIAFRRFRVKVNGGASGNGDVAVASLDTDDFDRPIPAESIDWITDSGSANRTNYAFTDDGNWYQYSFRTHTLESRRKVTAIRSTDGVVYRLQMLTYYDRFLISGYPTFRYVKS